MLASHPHPLGVAPRAALLLLALALALATVAFALSDTSGLEADGQGIRLARTWAFLRTGDAAFLARWGEPIFDKAVPMVAATTSPYPPVPGLLVSLPLLVLGPATEAQRLAMLLPALLLLAGVARLGHLAHGAWGGVVASGLLVGSALLANALRQPCGEVVVVAACAWAAAEMLVLARAEGQRPAGQRLPPGVATGAWIGLALLCKWTAAPLLLPAALALAGAAVIQAVRTGAPRHTAPPGRSTRAWAHAVAAVALGVFTVGALHAATAGGWARGLALVVPPALSLGLLVVTRHDDAADASSPVAPGALLHACARALCAAVLVATPWYAYAAPAIAEHVAGHVAMGTPFDPDRALTHANLAVAVGLPFAATWLGAGALGIVPRGRTVAVVAWATAALALAGALAAGRVHGFLNGEAQDRLLLPTTVALVLAASAAARLPRVAPLLGALATVGGLAGASSPWWGTTGQVVKSPGGALACGVLVEPRLRAYRWVAPGLAAAHRPLASSTSPAFQALLDALPRVSPPRTAALLADSGGCELGEGRLLELAARGRVVSLGPEEGGDARRVWAESRLGQVHEFVGWGSESSNLVQALAQRHGLSPRRAPGVVVAVDAHSTPR